MKERKKERKKDFINPKKQDERKWDVAKNVFYVKHTNEKKDPKKIIMFYFKVQSRSWVEHKTDRHMNRYADW